MGIYEAFRSMTIELWRDGLVVDYGRENRLKEAFFLFREAFNRVNAELNLDLWDTDLRGFMLRTELSVELSALTQ
jgi:hypothetical protein